MLAGEAPQPPPAAGADARADTAKAAQGRQQLSFLAEMHPMLEQIRSMDLDTTSPREALEFLYEARRRLDKGEL